MSSLWITGLWQRAYWTGDTLFCCCIKCRLCTQSTWNPRFSLASGVKNALHHLHCKVSHNRRGHFLLYHPASSLLCSLGWDFFFLTFSSFFFCFFNFDFDLHCFQLFTYVGNSLGFRGVFLLQCRVTVDNVFTPFEMTVLETVPSHLKTSLCCSISLVQDCVR